MASGEMRCKWCGQTITKSLGAWVVTLFGRQNSQCDSAKTVFGTHEPTAVPESAIEPEPQPCANCGEAIIEGPSGFFIHKAGHSCCGPNKFACDYLPAAASAIEPEPQRESRMSREQAREEAVRRWGRYSLATLLMNSGRHIVADPVGVRGASNISWEAAFADADKRDAAAKCKFCDGSGTTACSCAPAASSAIEVALQPTDKCDECGHTRAYHFQIRRCGVQMDGINCTCDGFRPSVAPGEQELSIEGCREREEFARKNRAAWPDNEGLSVAPGEAQREPHSIHCIHCPHVLQYHLSGVLEGTKRGCTQCDCPGFESRPGWDVAPDSPEAEQRRKHPHYRLIQRLDDFLHELCGDQKYRQQAERLHGEIHDAAYWFVTRQEISAEEHAQWRTLINQHLVAAREERDALRERAVLSEVAPSEHLGEKDECVQAPESDLARNLAGPGPYLTITHADTMEGKSIVSGWLDHQVRDLAANWIARAEARQRLADEAIATLREHLDAPSREQRLEDALRNPALEEVFEYLLDIPNDERNEDFDQMRKRLRDAIWAIRALLEAK